MYDENQNAIADELQQATAADEQVSADLAYSEVSAEETVSAGAEEVEAQGESVPLDGETEDVQAEGSREEQYSQKFEKYMQSKRKKTRDTSEPKHYEVVMIVDDPNEANSFAKPEPKFRIADFEGPIQMLLAMLNSENIRVEDFFISDVTSKYVEIIKNTPKEELDYDYAGEFVVCAACIVYLKSAFSLPNDENASDAEDDIAFQRDLFLKRMAEYELIQKQSLKLKEQETTNRFYREPMYDEDDCRVALVNFSLPKLVEAYARVLVNNERKELEDIPKKVVKDRFSVHEQMFHILEVISIRKTVDFEELFEPDYDRSDIVTTFLAVLELLKYGRLSATQEEAFGRIELHGIEGAELLPLEFEEGDDGKY